MTEEVKPSETGEESEKKEENTSEKPEQTVEAKLEEVKITEDKEKDENDNKEEGAQEEMAHNKENDGEEDEDGPELDDDEIEENPAYIPKKGRYYMHDSRDAEGPEDLDTKKSRADGAWSHDRYVERWQQPKSKKQLVARYGFDIRHNETEQPEGEEGEKGVPEESPPRNGEQSSRGRGRGRRGGRVFRGQGTRGSHEDREGSGDDERGEDQGEETHERGGSRRQRPSKPGVVRNVRGGRGQSTTNTRAYRNQERPRNGERQEREERRDEELPPRREKEEFIENHRRGAIRGAVRGFNAQPRQFVRTVSSSNRGGRYPEPRREQQNGRDMPTERRLSGGFTSRGRSVRGGPTRGSPRGGGDMYRGGAPAKRYPMRHDGPPLPPPQSMGPPRGYAPRQEVVFFDHPAPPPAPPAAHQSSPVVYFDPAAQQANRPLPPREKKIIEIKSPN